MLHCSKDAILRLFYNLSSSLLLLFIVFHLTSLLLAKLFIFLGGSPFYLRNQDGYDDFNVYSEEMEERSDYYRPRSFEGNTDLLANMYPGDESSIGNGSDAVLDELSEHNGSKLSEDNGNERLEVNESELLGDNSELSQDNGSELPRDNESELSPSNGSELSEENESERSDVLGSELSQENESELSDVIGSELSEENSDVVESELSQKNESELSEENWSKETCYCTPATELSVKEELAVDEKILRIDSDSDSHSEYEEIKRDPTSKFGTNPIINNIWAHSTTTHEGADAGLVHENQQKLEINLRKQEDFLLFQLDRAQGKRLVQERDECETSRDNFTIGSTSKDSSEWRSSTYCRESGTEDPFSSSSRRSCPNWESYTVFQKYDEEMLFLDRISVQKLQETESLRSVKVNPRSISERIAFNLKTKKTSEYRSNSYHELESAYVAQICLTWEALNWNYTYFQRLRASRREFDPGCPAYVAQQFQQFQVLLQRYSEDEPYEYGRRPEIYARIRSMVPKLLQVPEYRDSDDDNIEEGHGSRIPSNSFLVIVEESIRTFMSFLNQDKKTHCQILADFFKKKKKGSANANLHHLLKKVNEKKKAKLKEIRRSGNCIGKRKLRKEEELEILMALIDLKVVSRVIRMVDLSGEQLQWCENKMRRVRVSEGKLHRDSTPHFFTAN